jgi:hypothetical protein
MPIFEDMKQFVSDEPEFDSTKLKQPLQSNWCTRTCMDVICGYFLNKLSKFDGYKDLIISRDFVAAGLPCVFSYPMNEAKFMVSSTVNMLKNGNNYRKYYEDTPYNPRFFYKSLKIYPQYFVRVLNEWFERKNLFKIKNFDITPVVATDIVSTRIATYLDEDLNLKNVLHAVLIGVNLDDYQHQLVVCGLEDNTKLMLYDPIISYKVKMAKSDDMTVLPLVIANDPLVAIFRESGGGLLEDLAVYYRGIGGLSENISFYDSQFVEFIAPPLNELVGRKNVNAKTNKISVC